jgi:hypothetical protein
MNPLFVAALKEIKSAGVELTVPEDFDAIVRLRHLADRARAESGTDLTPAILRPTYRVGNVTLHRLTIAAQVFLADRVDGWFPTGGTESDLAVAFVLAHVPQFEAVIQPFYDDRAGFLRAVKAWRRGLHVTRQDLAGAISAFADQERKPVTGAGGGDDARAFGPMLEMLVREYGRTPHEWLFHVSAVEIETILGAREQRAIAQGLQEATGKGHPDPMRADLCAFRDFRKAVDALKARHT